MKKKLLSSLLITAVIGVFFILQQKNTNEQDSVKVTPERVIKLKKKTENERQLYTIERAKYEFDMQKNPITGIIPLEEKRKENDVSLELMKQKAFQRTTSSTYASRGPSNLG